MIMGWYVFIFSWMRDLGLKGNELLIFGVIFGFSHDGVNCFKANADYLADVCGATRRCVMSILKELTEKGLIVKGEISENGRHKITYRVADSILSDVQKFHIDDVKKVHSEYEKSSQRDVKKVHNDCAKIAHNNKYIIKDINKDNKERDDAPASPSPSRRFTPPTVDEVREYCRSRHNAVNAEAFVAFYTSNGWKVGKNTMKDWKAAVITWEKRDQTHTTPVFTGYTRPTAR